MWPFYDTEAGESDFESELPTARLYTQHLKHSTMFQAFWRSNRHCRVLRYDCKRPFHCFVLVTGREQVVLLFRKSRFLLQCLKKRCWEMREAGDYTTIIYKNGASHFDLLDIFCEFLWIFHLWCSVCIGWTHPGHNLRIVSFWVYPWLISTMFRSLTVILVINKAQGIVNTWRNEIYARCTGLK